MPSSHILFAETFFLNIIFDFSNNDSNSKKFAVYKAIYIRNFISLKSLNKININFLKLTLKKLLFFPYISNKDKAKLKIIFKEFV